MYYNDNNFMMMAEKVIFYIIYVTLKNFKLFYICKKKSIFVKGTVLSGFQDCVLHKKAHP